MVEEVVDVVILGASGYTGKYVLREILKFRERPGGKTLHIAIAGRSKKKLAAALTWAAQDPAVSPSIPIFEADVQNVESLVSLCQKTKLLISCVGPYRKYGLPVVKACVDAGVDYLDVTGEPEFMETVEALYHERAQDTGALILNACGYDSIPAELGVIFNTRQFEPPSVPNSVDSYLVLESDLNRLKGNIGTWESFVLSVMNVAQLQKLRKSRPRRARLQIPGGPAKKPGLVQWEEHAGGWAMKLPSADAAVVRRLLSTIVENPNGLPAAEAEDSETLERRRNAIASIKPVHYGCYVVQKSIIGVIGLFLIGLFVGVLGTFSLGRSMLLRYPEFFSFGVFQTDGPTEEEVNSSSFKMWFVGRGYSDPRTVTSTSVPDKQVVTRIAGPDIGYLTTPICLIQAALIVLDERKHLPKGGVYTPGTVLGVNDLQQGLQKNGISFDIVSTSKI